MPTVLKFVLRAVLVLALLVVFGASAVWNGASNTLERELGHVADEPQDVGIASTDLPAPVARFLERSILSGRKPIRTARLEQTGEFFLNGSWHPLTAHQFITASPPSFVWDARIQMAPLLSVYVRDSYVLGNASMRARMLAFYPLVDQANRPELKEGALMRYLGEAVWLPSRLAPGNGLTWAPVDEGHADATLTADGISVTLRFTIDADGAVTEIYAPGRFRELNGSYIKTPWRVRALGQESKGGVRIMSPAEAEWILPEGAQPYWRGRIVSAEYGY